MRVSVYVSADCSHLSSDLVRRSWSRNLHEHSSMSLLVLCPTKSSAALTVILDFGSTAGQDGTWVFLVERSHSCL